MRATSPAGCRAGRAPVLPALLLALLAGPAPGQTATPEVEPPKRPSAFAAIPKTAFAKVRVAPFGMALDATCPRLYHQTLTLTVDKSLRTGEKSSPQGRKLLKAHLRSTYTDRQEQFFKFQTQFDMERIEWREGDLVRSIPLADMADWPAAAHPLRSAFHALAARPVRVLAGRDRELLMIKGCTTFLDDLARPLARTDLLPSFKESLADIFDPHHLERTVLLLHPPVLYPPAGRLEPGRGWYRHLQAGSHRLLLSHTFMGSCQVGTTRCAVFWSTLPYPGEPKKKVRIKRRDWTVTVAPSTLAGVVRIDPATGHTMDAALEMVRDRTMVAGKEKVLDRTVLTLRLTTRQEKKKKVQPERKRTP